MKSVLDSQLPSGHAARSRHSSGGPKEWSKQFQSVNIEIEINMRSIIGFRI
jgi:hypothetical protein